MKAKGAQNQKSQVNKKFNFQIDSLVSSFVEESEDPTAIPDELPPSYEKTDILSNSSKRPYEMPDKKFNVFMKSQEESSSIRNSQSFNNKQERPKVNIFAKKQKSNTEYSKRVRGLNPRNLAKLQIMTPVKKHLMDYQEDHSDINYRFNKIKTPNR